MVLDVPKAPKITARDFRRTKQFLPEERKSEIEAQMMVIKELRERLLSAFRAGRPFPKKAQKRLSHAGNEGSALLEALMAPEDPGDASSPETLINMALKRLEAELGTLGGSTRAIVRKVLEELDLERYWFGEAFDSTEVGIFKRELFDNLPDNPSELRSLDVGIGVGRASLVALTAMQEKYGVRAARQFAKGIHGLDLMPRFVDRSRQRLAAEGVESGHIVEGDFLNLPSEFQKRNFDYIWMLMHTIFHCTTEKEMVLLMRNMGKALRKGGKLIFDSVALYHHIGIPDQRVLKNFNDLKNLYGLLVRRYRQEHVDLRIGESPDFRVVRHPVVDCTAGVGFYPREVLTRPYLKHILRKAGSGLKQVNPYPIFAQDQHFPDSQAIDLGMKWIRENNLYDWILNEVAWRHHQMDQGLETIQPLYALSAEEQNAAKASSSALRSDERVIQTMQIIAREMVKGYVQTYYILEKA